MTISKSLIINVYTNASPGSWRDPKDKTREFTRDIKSWINFAKLAEKGKIHAIFIADNLSFFDDYKGPGNYKLPAKIGAFSPRIDPAISITAMSSVTNNLGFGITFSTAVEHPYHFARRLASLDLLTNGRIGWNIVSSYLTSLGPNLLNGEALPEHDERYVKTEEYVDVVLKLLLSSWRDDAIKYDKKKGIFADPDLIRKINHKGKYLNVEGPGITEPTPQRFPVIFQAGTSTKGKLLAAKYAEVVFLDGRYDEGIKGDIKEIRRLAETYGRDPQSVKFIVGIRPTIGKTREELAFNKLEEAKKFKIPDYSEVVLSGISGIDLSIFEDDEEVNIAKVNEMATWTNTISKKVKKSKPTKRQLLDNFATINKNLIGTASEVANELERWVHDYDVDGFNLVVDSFPNDLESIVELLIPELQKRGIFHKDYTSSTLRENINHKEGQKFLREDHTAYKFKWGADKTKEEFESDL
ncbi:Nitrilotriacetate monooxygenase component A [Wickerhamomyces ciferrii]|uniref:Nitrilotriacetate monooxygenase component A n=1 Tax=Wickerhamomyces ciferrii (strain ATCC 14091 / BCRC 22168 / CBS 111 / JCM 3599 / NBRC 0793 / NRRL Y-1031 F-60-10) TaxID=1206466 RepID=K0KL56_WICCF|nr:Nitrilotriacetate monooxygenase component A [Wickerhamomyces ciferrii]CCH42917.1 Nitrilotriacetate monooxygenase component A [Wickerhamomyces ciferrii]